MKATLIFVVQRHDASHLHFDFRLQLGGVLKSWAVPKEPPTRPGIKRLAIETTDHPTGYADFQGTIPKGEYGAGTVETWDKGTLEYILEGIETGSWAYDQGKLEFTLHGNRLHGTYILTRIQGKGPKSHWLLIKQIDKKA
ncbi:MAG TPA: DNA polymerase ligase N-terminal domain-containing protein [Candidatus Saccharimonadales bacterium]|nr:DNA polymerase ligase N-terminal domain-containing protein [Candidatus Saccharimonadales bacterium]